METCDWCCGTGWMKHPDDPSGKCIKCNGSGEIPLASPPRAPVATGLTFNGFRVVVSPLLTETVQYSRSPSRAKRRQRRGFRQHYVERPQKQAIVLGDTMIVHPQMWAYLQAHIRVREERNPINLYDGRIRL